jgi:hypothetical protein
VTFGPDGSITDDGVVPLQQFVDEAGPDAAAITVETDDTGDIHPAAYVRRGGSVEEHVLAGDPLLRFEGDEQRSQLASALRGWVP